MLERRFGSAAPLDLTDAQGFPPDQIVGTEIAENQALLSRIMGVLDRAKWNARIKGEGTLRLPRSVLSRNLTGLSQEVARALNIKKRPKLTLEFIYEEDVGRYIQVGVGEKTLSIFLARDEHGQYRYNANLIYKVNDRFETEEIRLPVSDVLLLTRSAFKG